GSTDFKVKVRGLFIALSPAPLLFSFETSLSSGSFPPEIVGAGSFGAGARCSPAAGTRNQVCNLIAASRTEQFSIAATRSSTFPPRRPPRAAAHDCEWHDQAPPVPLLRVAIKLSLLSFELWLGRGHLPRRMCDPIFRSG